MKYPIVSFDIAGPDESTLREFYSSNFEWEAGETGTFEVSIVAPMVAAIREDPVEKRIYVGVPDVSVALDQIERSGGTVDRARFEVPGVLVIGLFRDPAGNPMGLIEMDGDTPKIP